MSIASPAVRQRDGFTIVELLIVIVVIGILAAITVVAYNGIQNRGYDVTVQSDLKTLAKKFEIYKVDNGVYPINGALGVTAGSGFSTLISRSAYTTDQGFNVLNCTRSSGTEYAVLAQSRSGKYFTIGSSQNVQEVTATVTLANTSSCPTILSSSNGNGTGWDSTNGWRPWTMGN